MSVSPASFKVAFRISKPSDEPFLYGKALGIGDGFQLTFDWNDPGSPPQNVPPQFRLHVDPAGVCVVMVKSSRFLGRADPSLCSATTSGPTGNSRTWTGTITVNWDTLRDPRWGMNLDQFELFANWFRATKHGQSSVEQIAISTCADTSAPSGCVAPAASQSYVAAIGDIGHEPDLPPHRLGIDAYLPVSRQILAGASFSDDSGAALNTRSTAVKALRGPQAKAYACHSCGSFQTDDASAFGAPFTSAGVLGSDLSAFGVDAPPFTMNSVSFPLDSAYKGVYVPFSSGGRSVTVGVAALNGNTKQSGYARDSVLTFAETILPLVQRVSDSPESSRYLREYDVGFIEANGNRTALAPSAGAFSTIPAPLLHSTNAQLELAYSWMSIGQGQRLASGVPERTDIASLVPQRRYAALLRYGAQDTAGGNVLDVAGSFRWQAAPVELNQQGYVGGSLSAAAGYRVVGPNYNPIDGAFDAHVAQHGAFGQVTYSYTLDRPQPEVTSLTVSEWSFADARPRDRALQMQFKTPFPVKSATAGIFSVQSNDTFGRISISQAGRASGIVVTDAAGGGGLLPNDQYNLQLNYALQKRLSMTAGYTYLDAQGCSTKLVAGPQPCYSYRQPQVVGDIAWTPFPLGGIWASTFVEASVQGSTTMPFETESDRVLQTGRFDYYQTTVGHVVRTGAVGMTLLKSPSGCATLLLSTANRGGDPDQFAKSAPVPGFTNTASLEYVAGGGFPSVLLAYSRIQNDVPSPPSSKVLILRLQLGAPFDSFGRSPHGKCGS
ncbi:MAG TPA: hypothetical protein VHS78_04125 [Candidatus Elarobacter sp.]|nr:hypothetical protein [Candidatus Elarobacter sp.]